MPADERIEFTVTAPSGNLRVQLVGRIIRAEMDPQVGLRMAIEFIDTDAASRAGLEALLSRLLQTPAAGPFDHLKPNSPPPEIKKALEAIPLPQRISLAARAGPKEREILRLDSQAAVLEALVKNPNLTLAEARSLAASTYLMPASLDALSSDLRFKDDEDLRITVASHPRVTMAIAERVTLDFRVPQLKKLLAKPGVNQILREKLIRKSNAR
jgi:hypothetical protein